LPYTPNRFIVVDVAALSLSTDWPDFAVLIVWFVSMLLMVMAGEFSRCPFSTVRLQPDLEFCSKI
ncbi:MAG: hypothetical protein KC561_01735, partial [Myxococcales bacterium]|nr:hypothetical protein [Myxococcales bacterium]